MTTPAGRATPATRDRLAAPWRHVDGVLVAATTSLAVLGCLMVYSATRFGLAQQGLDPTASLRRQVAFVAAGLVAMAVVALVGHHRLRALAPLAHGAALVLLVAVLTPLGTTVKGAQSWFSFGSFTLQPAELAKVTTIVVLAAHCGGRPGELVGRRLVGALAIAGVPTALVLLQPDLGSALVFVALTAGILVVAGARGRHLAALAAAGALAVGLVLQVGVLEGYQRDRLTAFATEGSSDRQGASFQLNQARTTIASGGLLGTGMFEGSQTKLGFVPEQQTDFIFTVVGEELGFVGSATVLGLYAVVAWRLWRAGLLARDRFGTLVAVGVLSLLVFHLFQNMGMAMGIMPITGIPLPLLSAGGSSVVATFAAVGLVLNVHMRRFT